LPFEDNYADRICAVHLFEHFYGWEAPEILTEWKRVLKPGGQLVIEVPSMDKIFSYIADCLVHNIDPKPEFSWLALWGSQEQKKESMTHKYGYSAASLQKLLLGAGYRDAFVYPARYHFAIRDMRFEAYKP
jgi:predicted SAM-dependent methyltransferase